MKGERKHKQNLMKKATLEHQNILAVQGLATSKDFDESFEKLRKRFLGADKLNEQK